MFLLTSPNQQLLAHFLMLLAACTFIGMGLMVVYRKQVQLYREQVALASQIGEIIPLWRHVLGESSATMRHDLPWALEQDVLMDEALKWNITPARRARLLELVAERERDRTHPLRKGERRQAKIYPILLELAYAEAVSTEKIDSPRMVGSRALERQSVGDARKQDAIAS